MLHRTVPFLEWNIFLIHITLSSLLGMLLYILDDNKLLTKIAHFLLDRKVQLVLSLLVCPIQNCWNGCLRVPVECVIKERNDIHGKSKQKSWLNHLFFTLMLRFSWLSNLVWLFIACFMVLLFLFGLRLIEMGSYSYCRITAASSSEVVRSFNHRMMRIFTLQNNFFNFQPLF